MYLSYKKKRQFLIKLAFAVIISKSQTFDRVGIDLPKNVFNYGQRYVAFSRVRSWKALKIYLCGQQNNKQVKKFGYKEIYI